MPPIKSSALLALREAALAPIQEDITAASMRDEEDVPGCGRGKGSSGKGSRSVKKEESAAKDDALLCELSRMLEEGDVHARTAAVTALDELSWFDRVLPRLAPNIVQLLTEVQEVDYGTDDGLTGGVIIPHCTDMQMSSSHVVAFDALTVGVYNAGKGAGMKALRQNLLAIKAVKLPTGCHPEYDDQMKEGILKTILEGVEHDEGFLDTTEADEVAELYMLKGALELALQIPDAADGGGASSGPSSGPSPSHGKRVRAK